MSKELKNFVHDLSNKLAIIDSKAKKAIKICDTEAHELSTELKKIQKNSSLSLEILSDIKKVLEESNS